MSSVAISERFGTAERFLEKESVADGPSPYDGSQGSGSRTAATGVSSRGLPGLPTFHEGTAKHDRERFKVAKTPLSLH
jgi:hypothetical protein